MDHLLDYLVFLAETATLVVAFVVLLTVVVGAAVRARDAGDRDGHLEVTDFNDRLESMQDCLRMHSLDDKQLKRARKADDKERRKRINEERRRVFVLDFDGDIDASDVDGMRHAITALLGDARDGDEVVLRLESPGGSVHAYGLAASHLERIRAAGLRLTVCVDRVAASGGYLMASVADHIVAAPFAMIGSIGVIVQLPNVHRLLKRHQVDYEELTAGEFKRTVSVFGENTDVGKAKLREELEDIHRLFKDHIAQRRPGVDIAQVATGEVWPASRALAMGLVDAIGTSDAHLVACADDALVLELRWVVPRSPLDRFVDRSMRVAQRLWLRAGSSAVG